MAADRRLGRSAAVVGGGLAGLAASCALADLGYTVTLLEKRPYLGGRASSYQHPGTGEIVDNCQHVLLGCCTNLLAFYRQISVADKIRWFDDLTFLEPGGRASHIRISGLPAPLHSSLSFLTFGALRFADKFGIARALTSLLAGVPDDTDENFLQWLRRHGQTERAIERFWKTVLVSALNEDLDRMSVKYAALVFRESFLKNPEGARMGVPAVPLTELYSAAGEYVKARGGEVRLRTGVDALRPEQEGVVLRVGEEDLRVDVAVLATPFDVAARLLPADPSADALRAQLGRFESSPITGVHFWFDRQITDLPHAVLLDRTIQWMFHKSMLLGRDENGGQSNSYVELVISSSKGLVELGRNEILDLALKELAEFFPAVRDAKVLKSAVIKEVHATYSALPRSDEYRPAAATAWPRLFLAGDWTQTGWPATMEGAVRSGYLAVEAIAKQSGTPAKILAPDMKPSGFMKVFG